MIGSFVSYELGVHLSCTPKMMTDIAEYLEMHFAEILFSWENIIFV